jgi:hypothetical protein
VVIVIWLLSPGVRAVEDGPPVGRTTLDGQRTTDAQV